MNSIASRIGDLIEIAALYYTDFCLDEASLNGDEITGCSLKQHLAAKRLGDCLRALGAEVP